jgi:hypothetical protein
VLANRTSMNTVWSLAAHPTPSRRSGTLRGGSWNLVGSVFLELTRAAPGTVAHCLPDFCIFSSIADDLLSNQSASRLCLGSEWDAL